MFTIDKMCPASEWYYLRLARYYFRRKPKSRSKKRRRGRGDGDDPADDGSTPDPDDMGLGDAQPFAIGMPGEPPGKWSGTGSLALGLTGTIQEEHYHRVFHGFHPQTGEPLVQNAGREGRCAGYEGCLSPIKDLSVLWSQCPPDVREAIQRINWRAAEETARFIEWHFAYSRAGKAAEGCWHIPVGLVLAMWEHASSRSNPPDPDLHIHMQIFNVGVDKEGVTRAIDPVPIFWNQRLFTAYYRAKLAELLRAELGIEFEFDRKGLRICGIPRDLVKQYSKRRQAITEWMAERGVSGAAAAAQAALETRDRKDPLVSRQELFQKWQKTNTAAGFDDRYVAQLLRHGPRKPNGTVKDVIREAIQELTRQTAHFGRRDLVLTVLDRLPKYGHSPDTAIPLIDDYLDHDDEIVPLGHHDGEQRFTTDELLEAECRLLHQMDHLASRPGNTLHDWEVERVLQKYPSLSEEQIRIVRHLTLTKSAVRIGLGLAGTGKTFAIKACVEAWKRRGFRVLMAAPTGQAARVLAKATDTEGETLTKLLGDFRLPLSAAVKHHARQLARVIRRRRTWRFRQPQPEPITPNTIVLVDEAGMMNITHATRLAEWVRREGATLCLIGDPVQLPAIDSASPLHSLAQRYGAARVTDIRRQRQVWARVAAQLFAEGEPAEAMEIFARRNRITIRETTEEIIQQACLDWTEEGLLTPHRAILLANTNDLAHTVALRCQEHRLRAGTISDAESTVISDETDDAIYESRVFVGDRVLFTKNSRGFRGYGVDNGSLGTVTAISPFGSTISVSLDDGRCVRVDVHKFPHVRLGYAVTTYKSQGASIPKVFVLIAGNPSLQNLPASYVQATRAIEDTQFYTTRDLLDLFHGEIQGSPLIKHMSRRPNLRLATELLQEALETQSFADPVLQDLRPPSQVEPIHAEEQNTAEPGSADATVQDGDAPASEGDSQSISDPSPTGSQQAGDERGDAPASDVVPPQPLNHAQPLCDEASPEVQPADFLPGDVPSSEPEPLDVSSAVDGISGDPISDVALSDSISAEQDLPEQDTPVAPLPTKPSSHEDDFAPEAADETQLPGPEVVDEAHVRKLALRLKRIRAAQQAWTTHTRQENADALERERLIANSQLNEFCQRLKVVRQIREDIETGDLLPGSHDVLRDSDGDLLDAPEAGDPAQSEQPSPSELPPAPWVGSFSAQLSERIETTSFLVKQASLDRRREELRQGHSTLTPPFAAAANAAEDTDAIADSSVVENPNEGETTIAADNESTVESTHSTADLEDRSLPSSPEPQTRPPTAWELAFRQTRQQLRLQRRRNSLRQQTGGEQANSVHTDARRPGSAISVRDPSPEHPKRPVVPQPQPQPQQRLFSPEDVERERRRREEAEQKLRNELRELLLLRLKDHLRRQRLQEEQEAQSQTAPFSEHRATGEDAVEDSEQHEIHAIELPNDNSIDLPPNTEHHHVSAYELSVLQHTYGVHIARFEAPDHGAESPFVRDNNGPTPHAAIPQRPRRTRQIYIPGCGRCGGGRCGNFPKVLHVTDD